MLYKYAMYAKNNKKTHYSLCVAMLVIFIIHIIALLETENLILLLALALYIPIYMAWSRTSTIKERMPD